MGERLLCKQRVVSSIPTFSTKFMVAVAKWSRPRVVIAVLVGSIPTSHPNKVFVEVAQR